jgi:hypothetical protein
VKNANDFSTGLIVIGDLPNCARFFKVVSLYWVINPYERCEDFSKWSHCYERLAQVKNAKIFQSSLIVIGDLPK